MKKLQLPALSNMKRLKRNELKNLFGGYLDSGEATGSGQGYMCCNHAGCSICVTPARPACIAGAWPVPC